MAGTKSDRQKIILRFVAGDFSCVGRVVLNEVISAPVAAGIVVVAGVVHRIAVVVVGIILRRGV